jgi:hypothetical protein
MPHSFQDIKITGLIPGQCYTVEHPVVRVCFQLSSPPVVGWSFMFTHHWQAMQYAGKCRAGMEGDVLWIECDPAEVAERHLPLLRRTVEQTNTSFWDTIQSRAEASRHRQELDQQTRAKLDQLAATIDLRPPDSSV